LNKNDFKETLLFLNTCQKIIIIKETGVKLIFTIKNRYIFLEVCEKYLEFGLHGKHYSSEFKPQYRQKKKKTLKFGCNYKD
jgi:hypothetical protein